MEENWTYNDEREASVSSLPTRTRAEPKSQVVVAHEAAIRGGNAGWEFRIPIRASKLNVQKEVLVREEVVANKEEREEQVRLEESVRREDLRVGTEDVATVRENESKHGRSL